jgi:DNA repair exonuclease SbcCD nuclease subunit
MSKFIVFSDLHAHPFRQFSENGSRLENCLGVISDVFHYANEHGCKIILFCGDMFHEPGKISTIAFNKLVGILNRMHEMYPEIRMIAISGNHDQQGRNTLDTPSQSAMEALAEAVPEVITIWDNCADLVEGVHICGIPYYEFPEDFSRVLEGMVESIPLDTPSILMMHQVPTGSVDPIPAQIDSRDIRFGGFSVVLNGHIHRHQSIRNTFITVGSPLHQDLGDIDQTKGILLLDTDTKQMTRIPLDYPEFRRISYGESIPEAWHDDYIVMDPPPIEEKANDMNLQNFSTTNAPRDIVKSYGEHHKINEDLLTVGLSLL